MQCYQHNIFTSLSTDKICHTEEGCERQNLGHSTSLHVAAVMEQRSFLLHANGNEELSLNCYQSAEVCVYSLHTGALT